MPICRRQQIDGGGDLPANRRARRGRSRPGCRGAFVHGPRVRRAADRAAAAGRAAGTSVRARGARAQEQNRRLAPVARRDLRHDRRWRQRCVPTICSALLALPQLLYITTNSAIQYTVDCTVQMIKCKIRLSGYSYCTEFILYIHYSTVHTRMCSQIAYD